MPVLPHAQREVSLPLSAAGQKVPGRPMCRARPHVVSLKAWLMRYKPAPQQLLHLARLLRPQTRSVCPLHLLENSVSLGVTREGSVKKEEKDSVEIFAGQLRVLEASRLALRSATIEGIAVLHSRGRLEMDGRDESLDRGAAMAHILAATMVTGA